MKPADDSTLPPDPAPAREGRGTAPNRTMLAAERTQLAWWRTAFAVLAVGLAIGKIVPQLAGEEVIWPYTVLGTGFALYSLVLMIHGRRRREQVELAVRTGERIATAPWIETLITGGAILLALATTAMIIFN